MKQIVKIDLRKIDSFKDHSFRVENDESLKELKSSIKEHGLLNPLVVREKENGRYEMISGHRRKLALELQKQVYMIGHEANYLSFNENENYVLDRFFYSTIIRLNYELKRSVSDTVNEILEIQILPDIVIYLNTDKKIVLNRLIKREGFPFDDILFEYENEVFKQLSKKCDKMIIVDNNNNINNTVNEIDNQLRLKKILLKRR